MSISRSRTLRSTLRLNATSICMWCDEFHGCGEEKMKLITDWAAKLEGEDDCSISSQTLMANICPFQSTLSYGHATWVDMLARNFYGFWLDVFSNKWSMIDTKSIFWCDFGEEWSVRRVLCGIGIAHCGSKTIKFTPKWHYMTHSSDRQTTGLLHNHHPPLIRIPSKIHVNAIHWNKYYNFCRSCKTKQTQIIKRQHKLCWPL